MRDQPSPPSEPTALPPDLPEPIDDGAADHLPGATVPTTALPATDRRTVDLRSLSGRTVLFCVPGFGTPAGREVPEGWRSVPGAFGCTAEACGFRDHYRAIRAAGVDRVLGLSGLDLPALRRARDRLGLPIEFLSDSDLGIAEALDLPMLSVDGDRYVGRLTLVVDDVTISKVWYPVFPPDDHAAEVLAWLGSGTETEDVRAP